MLSVAHHIKQSDLQFCMGLFFIIIKHHRHSIMLIKEWQKNIQPISWFVFSVSLLWVHRDSIYNVP